MDTKLIASEEEQAIALVALVIGRNMGLPASRVLRAAKNGNLLSNVREFYRREPLPSKKDGGGQ